jgi:pyruvate-ferredoxin/flavodoxin oxidoreductase
MVGANKNSVKILSEDEGRYAQGYFVYDSHKPGARTVSHLSFGPKPIRAPYLIGQASFIACHQFNFLKRSDVLELAAPRATLLLNCPHDAGGAWVRMPHSMRQTIIDKRLRLFVIDATRVAREPGLGGLINTVLQTCFFAISGVLPRDGAVQRTKKTIEKSYGRKGQQVVARNLTAVDMTLAALREVAASTAATCRSRRRPPTPRVAARLGRIRSSRTTPSSAWASGWPRTCRASWPLGGCASWRRIWARTASRRRWPRRRSASPRP